MSLSTISAVLSLLLFMRSDVQSSIIVPPQNQVVIKGQTATFSCTTNNTDDPNPITWKVNNVSKVAAGCITTDSTYRGQLSDRTCNVQVTPSDDNRLDVAGSYDCNDDTSTKAHRAILIVMVSNPLCVTSSQPIKGRPFTMSCGATLTAGPNALVNPPLTAWIQCQGLPRSTTATTQPRVHKTAMTFPVTPTSGGRLTAFNCKIHFSFVDVTHSNVIVATNEVTRSFISLSTMPVEVCPERMNITRSFDNNTGGYVLTCYAHSTLTPLTYRWTDATGAEVGQGQTFTLPEAVDPLSYTCTASIARLTDCSNSTTITRTATGTAVSNFPSTSAFSTGSSTVLPSGDTYTDSEGSNSNAAVIALAVLFTLSMVAHIVVIVWCLRKHWSDRKSPLHDNDYGNSEVAPRPVRVEYEDVEVTTSNYEALRQSNDGSRTVPVYQELTPSSRQ